MKLRNLIAYTLGIGVGQYIALSALSNYKKATIYTHKSNENSIIQNTSSTRDFKTNLVDRVIDSKK